MEDLYRKENFVKTNDAIYEVFADILRDQLFNQIAPEDLRQKLNETSGKKLKRMNITDDQDKVIEKAIRTGTYKEMDITLLCTLLRNICSLDRPLLSDIDQIRQLRNICCGHSYINEMDKAEFHKKWKDFESLCRRMDTYLPNNGYLNRLNELRERETVVTMRSDENQRAFRVLKKTDIILDKWCKEDTHFVITRGCQLAEKMITEDSVNIVTIAGSMGSGKSAIVHHIAIKYRLDGWNVFPVCDIRDIENLVKFEDFSSKQLFVFDDPIGKDVIDENLIIDWYYFERKVAMFPVVGNVKFLFTCRKQILTDLRTESLLLTNVVSLEEGNLKLTVQERCRILQCHLSETSYTEQQIRKIAKYDSIKYFPLLCTLFASKMAYQKEGIQFFLQPREIIEREVTIYREKDIIKFCALVLLTQNKGLYVKGFQWEESIFRHILNLFGVANTVSQSKICEQYDILSGHLLKTEGEHIQFYSEFIMDVVTYVFGKEFPNEAIKICSTKFLRRSVFFADCKSHLQQGNFAIVLPEQSTTVFIERVLHNLNTTYLDICLCPSLRSPMVISSLRETILSLKDEEFNKLFLTTIPCQKVLRSPWPLSRLQHISGKDIYHLLFKLFNPHLKESKPTSKAIKVLDIDFDTCTPVSETSNEFSSFCCTETTCEEGIIEIQQIEMREENCEEEEDMQFTPKEMHALIMDIFSSCIPKDILQDTFFALTKAVALLYPFEDFDVYTPTPASLQRFQKTVCQILLSVETICTDVKRNEISELSFDVLVKLISLHNDREQFDIVRQCMICLLVENYSPFVRAVFDLTRDFYNTIPLCHRHIIKEIGVEFFVIIKKIISHFLSMDSNEKYFYEIPTKEYWLSHFDILLGDPTFPVENVLPLGIFLNFAFHHRFKQCSKEQMKINMAMFGSELTPCLCLALFGHDEIVDAILSRVCKLENKIVAKVAKKLFLAGCASGSFRIVEKLFNFNRETSRLERWYFGQNSHDALQISSALHHYEIVSFLLQNKFDVNVVDIFGNTPLLLTLQYMNRYMTITDKLRTIQILKCLLKYGADIKHTNFDGYCALHLACKFDYPDIVKLFSGFGSVQLKTSCGNTPLIIASEYGNVEVVKMLLKRGADVNIRNDKKCSPFFVSSKNGNTETMQILLQKGALINSPDENKVSPLSVSSREGHVDAVKFLLSQKADIHQRDSSFNTPLLWAAISGHMQCIELLIEGGANINDWNEKGENLLFLACKKDDFAIVQMVLELNVDKEKSTVDGKRPIVVAAMSNNTDIVRLLLQKGARVNSNQSGNISALHFPLVYENEEMLTLLLEHNANVNDINAQGMSIFQTALSRGNINIVSKLLHYNCDISVKNACGETAFHTISRMGNSKLLQLLLQLKGGIDLDDKNVFKETALYLAAAFDNCKIVEILISNGSDMNICDYIHTSPLYIASKKGHTDIVSVLLNSGAKYELLRFDLSSPLMTAAANGHLRIVEILLNFETDVNHQDNKGRTALWYAAANGRNDVVSVLLWTSDIDVNISSNDGVSPLTIASGKEYSKIVIALLRSGAVISRIRVITSQSVNYSFIFVYNKKRYIYQFHRKSPLKNTRQNTP